MVSTHALLGTTAAVAGLGGAAAGFAIDRALADSPVRRERRVPDIARPDDRGDYYASVEGEPGAPDMAGRVANGLNLWLPLAGVVLGAGVMASSRGFIPVDRNWARHPIGVASVALGAVSLGWFAGASSSRLALG